nr:serine/threonine/tyrosine-interacting-like protein 1 [Loxodonta africana]
MDGLVLCEPMELYNILNQVTKLSRLTEPNYLCLLDVRTKREYDESHVITARRVKQKGKEYLIPESVDLECVKYCVVYDSNTSSLERILEDNDDENSDNHNQGPVLGAAIECGRVLTHLTHRPVSILRGGYELFSARYHFFRTQKVIWMPQELDAFQPYPVEIMPGRIYLGNSSIVLPLWSVGLVEGCQDGAVSVCPTPCAFLLFSFIGDPDRLLHIQVEDSLEAKISPFLRHLCHFIDIHFELDSVILVFSKLGISRSCVAIIAYLMHRHGQTLKRSWNYVKKCKGNMSPNRAFVDQLRLWEKIIVGDFVTDTSDLLY